MAMTPRPDLENDPQLAATYRAGTNAESPAHLDDAIRAAARREVAAGPRRAGIRRWAVPVSLAAVLVLSVSVVTLMREQGADRPESMILPPAATMQSEIVKRETAEPPSAAAPEAMPKRGSATPPQVVAPAPPAAQAGAPAPSPSGRVAEAERGVTDSRAKAMAAESNRAADSAVARREYAAPQPQLRSTPAPAPAPAPMADAAGGAGVSAAKPAAPVGALSAAPAKSALWQDLVKAPPEKWVQRIAELRRDGQTADADALVAEFRRRFPDARLPEDLR
jgi:hypothetical protein